MQGSNKKGAAVYRAGQIGHSRLRSMMLAMCALIGSLGNL